MTQQEQEYSEFLLQKQYHIPYELFKSAFTAFQKKFVYPKNYIIIAVLLLVCCIYAYFLVIGSDSDKPVYCIVILGCLLLSGFQWYNPRKIKRNLMLAVREIENDQYKLTIYPEYLEIGTILPLEDNNLNNKNSENIDNLFDDIPEENFSGTRIYYNKGLHVHEYQEFFMIYQTKTMFYVVPKSVFSEQELEIMRVHFSQRLNK
ncbi:MAG: YcxB family protein, partial [Oscillospiraceae bacterium]|nr:YcxB family protein [Oscillospiraceae bacterium]